MKPITDLINLINLNYPYNYLIVASILVIGASICLPLFGKLIDLLIRFEEKILKKTFSDKVSRFIIYRLTFVGTMIHEIAHALFAKLLGAKITSLNLIEVFNGNQLGSCEFQTRGGLIKRQLQAFYSSLAPVLVNTSLSIGIIYLLKYTNSIWIYALCIYLIISLLNHAQMSNQDLKLFIQNAFISIPITIGIMFLVLSLTIKIS